MMAGSVNPPNGKKSGCSPARIKCIENKRDKEGRGGPRTGQKSKAAVQRESLEFGGTHQVARANTGER